MKINKHIVNQKVADTVDAGLSVVPTFAKKPSALVAAIRRAIHSSPFMLPVFACVLPGMVFASPEGGQVVAGSATISNPDANTTLITQSTAQTAIDWQRFNIGAQEYVQFVQPDSSSVALNRVIGGNPSEILGNLSANGQVFLVNPNGVYFGQHATIDVGGIVASVLDIGTDDFMAGNYVFSKADGAPGDAGVVNDGLITAREGGYVVLMGDYAHNNGIISARLGTVALAAGNRVTMDVKGNGLVSVVIEEETLADVAGVNNTGEIIAAGGRVIMSAKVANDLIDTAINNEGLVVANSITERDGLIFLTAAGGDVVNSGTLDASAEDGSNVDGGGVLVYSGRNVINASGAIISATGDGNGDGGVVRVIAEEFMGHQSGARIDVTSDVGNGGFVEVSGHGSLAIRGDVDIGMGGELLIDPAVLTINVGAGAPAQTATSIYTVGETFIEDQLNAGANVTLVAGDSINASAALSIDAINVSAGNLAIKIGTLSFTSITGSLAGGSGFNCSGDGFCGAGGSISFTPDTNGSINLGAVSFNLTGGLSVAGGTVSGTVALGDINAGGDVSITAGDSGNIQLTGNTITAGGDVSLTGDIGSAGNLRAADLTINAGDHININSDIYLDNNNLILAADKNANNIGDVNINGQVGDSVNIETKGAINISGQNFNVVGATSAGLGATATSQVFVKADDGNAATTTDNITIIVAGNMNVTGGTGTACAGDCSPPLAADVSTNVSAGNNITINASSLNISGGKATGTYFSGSTAITARANATVTAGRNLTATLGGNLNVSGGIASAGGSSGTINISADANAALVASGILKVDAAGSILLSPGTITSTVLPPVTATLSAGAIVNAGVLEMTAASNITGNSAVITTTGNATFNGGVTVAIDAASALTAGGDLSITGGSFLNANNANYLNFSGANLLLAAGTGNLDINFDIGSATTVLNANATLSAGGNLNLNNNIYLGNNSLVLLADSDTSGAGDVVFGTGTTVSTLGSMNVSGINIAATSANFNALDLTLTATGNITGTNAVITTGNAATYSAGGNITQSGSLITGGNLLMTAGGSLSLSDVVDIGGTNLQLTAGSDLNLNAALGTSSSVINADVALSAGGNLNLNNNIFLGNNSLTLLADSDASGAGNVVLTGAPVTPITVSTVGKMAITGVDLSMVDASLNADGELSAVMTGSIAGGNGSISAGGLYMAAAGNIDLLSNVISVGTGTVTGVTGDAITLEYLTSIGITSPTTANPNAKFSSGGTLGLGAITMAGDVPYLWLEADTTNLTSMLLPGASDVVVQFSPFTLTATIGVEATSDAGQMVNYNNLEHFGILPGTTIIIGSSSHQGDIVIGNLENVDIVSKNMVAVTSTKVSSIGRVISTGIVGELIIGAVVFEDEFITPVQTEVELSLKPVENAGDEKEKKKKLVTDDESEINMCEVS